MREATVALAGNPNSGKSTVFNALTGAKQRVGNWPGVTVEKKTGVFRHGNASLQVVDLPGIYSLAAYSEDEKVASAYLTGGEPDLVVNIVDAVNLERGLYLTLQLIETGANVLVALNMMDIVDAQGTEICAERLADCLGCSVVPITATRKKGIQDLKIAIRACLSTRSSAPPVSVPYPAEIVSGVKELARQIESSVYDERIDVAWLALKLLEGDPYAETRTSASIARRAAEIREEIEVMLDEELEVLVADSRYGTIGHIASRVVRRKEQAEQSLTDRIDAVLLHRIWSIPIFLAVMYLVFVFSINVGGAFIDFFDILAGAVFVDGIRALLSAVQCPPWLVATLADGIGGSFQTIATFVPPIAFMFVALATLEDSGYMARAAFVMDRLMQSVGLPGKSFIPMLVGFGCNVPAIMATRTLENQRDRLMTIMMNPFMSCGARLPVYALFAAAFFPEGGQNIVFALYVIGIVFAVLTGLALKSTILAGPIAPFVMELPMYHVPTARGVLLTAWDRLKAFVFKAGKILIPVILLLTCLNTLGTDGSVGNENSEKSVLAGIGKTIAPVFAPMGITRENWPAAVGLFTGVFAKEAVVGTLDALYGAMEQPEPGDGKNEETGGSFTASVSQAFCSVFENLGGLASGLTDPLGISVGDVSDLETASRQQEVGIAAFRTLTRLFQTKAAAFSYMLFVLLYFPCVAALAAVYRETGIEWTVFAAAWTTAIAYAASVVFYQLATYHQHPKASLNWTIAIVSLFAIVLLSMKFYRAKKSAKIAIKTHGNQYEPSVC